MRLKSRGLGRKELVMDFREYTVTREGDEIVIAGTIREPVHWEFSIRMCQDDLPGIVKLAASRRTLGFFLKAAFTRNKDSHWSVSREEHLKLLKENAEQEKAAEKDKPEGKAKGAKAKGANAKAKGDKDPDATASDAKEATDAKEAARPGSADRAQKLAAAKAAAAKAKEGATSSTSAASTAASTASAGAASKPASARPSAPSGKMVSFARAGSSSGAESAEPTTSATTPAKVSNATPSPDGANSKHKPAPAEGSSDGAGTESSIAKDPTELEATSERNAS